MLYQGSWRLARAMGWGCLPACLPAAVGTGAFQNWLSLGWTQEIDPGQTPGQAACHVPVA